MKRQLLAAKQDKTPLPGDALVTVQEIARRFVRRYTSDIHSASRHLPDGKDHTVLLEGEVDGVRYFFVRQALEPPSSHMLFSPREQEIARLVAKGHPNKVIAAILDISPWTVCTHLRRMFAKIGVGSRAALVAKLLEDESNSNVVVPQSLHKVSK